MAMVDVLIPTYRRKTGLAVVLTSLLGQTFTDFDVIISDQTAEDETYLDSIEIQTLIQALRWHGHNVMLYRHLPRRGMAEQRQFLLECSARPSSAGCPAPYVHYLDDDVLLDPSVIERMLAVLQFGVKGKFQQTRTEHMCSTGKRQFRHLRAPGAPVIPVGVWCGVEASDGFTFISSVRDGATSFGSSPLSERT